MEEIWKKVESLNNRYEISNKGNIRNAETGKILKQFLSKFGYKILTVRPEMYVQKNVRIHQLVAEAFLGEKPEGYVINHKDGDKTNNNVENLEYVTPSQNNQHALDMGLRKPPDMSKYALRGEKHPYATITENDVRMILELHEKTGFGCRRLAKLTGISYGVIDGILMGKTWKHVSGGKNE